MTVGNAVFTGISTNQTFITTTIQSTDVMFEIHFSGQLNALIKEIQLNESTKKKNYDLAWRMFIVLLKAQ